MRNENGKLQEDFDKMSLTINSNNQSLRQKHYDEIMNK
jgi:hypothetical protein